MNDLADTWLPILSKFTARVSHITKELYNRPDDPDFSRPSLGPTAILVKNTARHRRDGDGTSSLTIQRASSVHCVCASSLANAPSIGIYVPAVRVALKSPMQIASFLVARLMGGSNVDCPGGYTTCTTWAPWRTFPCLITISRSFLDSASAIVW